ncbi:hypothetical protein KSP39_PZI012080 [Platanthera zijinensis]|uniref:K-box domain-containing protein n=1 Tax=Platanthera zijinensis TaxID=2320716 RepID=A0AAP0BFA3_9ASPA
MAGLAGDQDPVPDTLALGRGETGRPALSPQAASSRGETGQQALSSQAASPRGETGQQALRNLLGEDLGQLTTKELEQLEYQLEMSLRQIRQTKKNLDLAEFKEGMMETLRALLTPSVELAATSPPVVTLAWGCWTIKMP